MLRGEVETPTQLETALDIDTMLCGEVLVKYPP